MNDEIVAFLRENPEGTSSSRIAERFLKIHTPDHKLVHRAVMAILIQDQRCILGSDNLWHAVQPAAAPDGRRLDSLPWVAVSLLMHRDRPFHLSAWSVLPAPAQIASIWLADPYSLAHDEVLELLSPSDPPYDASTRDDAVAALAGRLQQAVPFMISGAQASAFSSLCSLAGESLPDHRIIAWTLATACGIRMPRPVTIETCHRALFGSNPALSYAASSGRILAECLIGFIERLGQNRIETIEQLEEKEEAENSTFDFTGKQFSLQDLSSLPRTPGVYGFADAKGKIIYIGKATNLRRRVLSYFRISDESPAKLDTLRTNCRALMTYRCGSDLESLLLEYRLIQKHSPALNTQSEINERKGMYKPLPDCIILLPHAEEGKGLSVWFRSSQKITLRSFNTSFNEEETMPGDLQTFFYSQRLPPTKTDFPEQEIALRWIKRHFDALSVVPAHRLASGMEIYAAMKALWRDHAGNYPAFSTWE